MNLYSTRQEGMEFLFIFILQTLHHRMIDLIRMLYFSFLCYCCCYFLKLYLILPNYFYKDLKIPLDIRNKKKMVQICTDVKNKLQASLFFRITFYFFSTLIHSQSCTYYSFFGAIMKTSKCPWCNPKRRLNFGPASWDLCVMCCGLELSRLEWRKMR